MLFVDRGLWGIRLVPFAICFLLLLTKCHFVFEPFLSKSCRDLIET